MINKLNELIEEVLEGIKLNQINDPKVGCHELWDSMGHFNLLMTIEDEFNIKFTTKEVTELKSLAQIEESLKKKGID